MFLISRLRRRWQLMRAERAKGEASRQRVFESLKRARDKERRRIESIRRIKAQQKAEEYKQQVKEEAYLLWEADGKPEGKDDYYWKLAVDKIEEKNLFFIYRIYYLFKKRILEPIDAWISKQAFFTILGRLGELALIVAVVSFVFGENVRRNNEVFAAWTTITTAHEQSGSGGRIRALEFLNSRPLRFPWIWGTIDLFWDGKECKRKLVFGRRWKREPLAGLSARKAYLANIHLCGADLGEAEFQDANLEGANLQQAVLERANLQEASLWLANLQQANLGGAKLQQASLSLANLQQASLSLANLQQASLWQANLQQAYLSLANLQGTFVIDTKKLTSKQIKSTCFWKQAIYKGEWNEIEEAWVAIEPDNTNFIEELKKDTASDPEEPIDCSLWEQEN